MTCGAVDLAHKLDLLIDSVWEYRPGQCIWSTQRYSSLHPPISHILRKSNRFCRMAKPPPLMVSSFVGISGPQAYETCVARIKVALSSTV
jgi:hypothetical protein